MIRGRVEVKSTAACAASAIRNQQVIAGQAIRVPAGGGAMSPILLDRRRFEAARTVAARPCARPVLPAEPLPKGRPIWLGNLFDDFAVTGLSLASALASDEFRARAEDTSLGVNRVLYAGGPIKEIAPGITFDATNLGWQDVAVPGGHVTNDAWSDFGMFADANGAGRHPYPGPADGLQRAANRRRYRSACQLR